MLTVHSHHARLVLTATGAAGLLSLALAGCAPASSTTGAGTSAAPAATAGNAGGGAGNASAPSQPGSPQINSFAVTQQPSCPVVATSDAPFGAPGRDITLSWKVSGATGVALSIDDPGFYNQYGTGSYGSFGAQGSQTLSFPCDTSQRNTTHTYTINTTGGGGGTVAKTITVTVLSQP